MTTTTSGRRIIATLAATALAAIGLAAATESSAQGAVLAQKVNVTVTTGGGTVYTNTPVRADFTLANPSTNTGNVDVFSVVVPAGVTGVTIGGASGPTGSVWREALLPCGTRSNCSKILLVYPASFPLSKSFLHPGQSMVASILFTTGNKAGNLPFSFIGIGNGVFTANSTPTITVVNGDAADYLVTGDATVTAGVPGHYAFHAQNIANQDVPFAGGDVTFTLGVSDDIVSPPSKPKLTYNGTDYSFSPADGTHSFPWAVVHFDSSGAALGIYNFMLTLNKAGGNSLTAGATGKVSIPQGIVVSAAPATTVALIDVTDAGTPPSPDLSAGKPFNATFSLADQFGNPALLSSPVTFSAVGTGSGTLTQGTIVGPDYSTNPIKPGTIPGSWSTADPAVTFTATLGESTSSKTKPVVPAESTALIGTGGGTVGTGAGCDPTVTTCGSATFPASTNAPFTATVGVNFCGANDPCTTGQPQILAVTGIFLFTPTAPASATSTCPATLCPRVPHYSTITYYHWKDNVDHDFECVATSLAGCVGPKPNGCVITFCDPNDADGTLSDNEPLNPVIDHTVQGPQDGWVSDVALYPNGQAQSSAVSSAPWLAMPDCVNGGTQLPSSVLPGQSTIACIDKTSYVRASDAADAPLLVTWRFVGDPRTHAPAA